jgi:hypothetical protein
VLQHGVFCAKPLKDPPLEDLLMEPCIANSFTYCIVQFELAMYRKRLDDVGLHGPSKMHGSIWIYTSWLHIANAIRQPKDVVGNHQLSVDLNFALDNDGF